MVHMEDITEKKQAEEALADNQRTLDTLMHNLPGMVYRCRNDPDWTMEFASGGCKDLTGYDPGDLIDNRVVSYGSLIVPEDRQHVFDESRRVLKTGSVPDGVQDHRQVRPDPVGMGAGTGGLRCPKRTYCPRRVHHR